MGLQQQQLYMFVYQVNMKIKTVFVTLPFEYAAPQQPHVDEF